MLTVAGLSVRYGSALALDLLDLAVRRDELFVLLGASGSGKTTLLRALGGFVRPDAGRIILNGTDMTALPPHRRPINTMFQSYALFPHLSVAANIGFGLRRRGVSRAETKQRVAAMLALVRMEGFGPRRPAELSGGQQQRVAVARAMVTEPALILADEPTANLDSASAIALLDVMEHLNRETGTTFIFSTHDPQVMERAHRLIRLRDGEITRDDTRSTRETVVTVNGDAA